MMQDMTRTNSNCALFRQCRDKPSTFPSSFHDFRHAKTSVLCWDALSSSWTWGSPRRAYKSNFQTEPALLFIWPHTRAGSLFLRNSQSCFLGLRKVQDSWINILLSFLSWVALLQWSRKHHSGVAQLRISFGAALPSPVQTWAFPGLLRGTQTRGSSL